MATKDEYYQKILASQQAEITSLKTALADMRKELTSLRNNIKEAPKASKAPKKDQKLNFEHEEVKQFFQKVGEVCDETIQRREAKRRNRLVGKTDFEKFQRILDGKFLASDDFTNSQKKFDFRLNKIEEKLQKGFCIFAFNFYSKDGDKGFWSIFSGIFNFKDIEFQGCLPFTVLFICAILIAYLLTSISCVKFQSFKSNNTIMALYTCYTDRGKWQF